MFTSHPQTPHTWCLYHCWKLVPRKLTFEMSSIAIDVMVPTSKPRQNLFRFARLLFHLLSAKTTKAMLIDLSIGDRARLSMSMSVRPPPRASKVQILTRHLEITKVGHPIPTAEEGVHMPPISYWQVFLAMSNEHEQRQARPEYDLSEVA